MARVAVVTGGTRGIGQAISMTLKKRGHRVVANYAGNDNSAQQFQVETGIPIYRWDVGDYEESATALRRIEAEVGPIDMIVNNAGVTRDAMLHKLAPVDWNEVIRINLHSMYNVTQPVLEGMRNRGWGRIISIASINGQKGQMGQCNYSAAKAGVIGFTKALAQETAKKGITVNCVAPGYIDTDMVAKVPKNVLEAIIAQIPVGRLGTPAEIASCVAFLASDDAAFITGATITANGGQYVTS
jgi:acetoacetyl-CoA reductase